MKLNGFSLIEVTISTAIIAIISAIVFTGYRQMGRVNFLEDQADLVASRAEDVRATALSAVEMKKDGNQVEYFTITFNENSYTLFKGVDGHEREHYFEGDVQIVEGAGRSVGFIPPEPRVVFLDDQWEELSVDQKCIQFNINYGHDSEDQDLILMINRVGLIKVSDEIECN